MKYLDTHCHLDLAKDTVNLSQRIEQENRYTIAVTNLPLLFQKNKIQIPETKYIKHALGYHPELISQFPKQLELFKRMINKTRYIGEVGMDGSKIHKESSKIQRTIFENILYLCEHDNKIITIHSRKAEKETIMLLKKYTNSKKILHWYTGEIKYAKDAIDVGCYFSFNQKMLSTSKGKELLRLVPKDKILLESDFPFGYKNETRLYNNYFKNILEKIAKLKLRDVNDIETQIFWNQMDLLSED